MKHANDLIPEDRKILVDEPFFQPHVPQRVVPLSEIQEENYLAPVYIETPRIVVRPARKSYNSFALALILSIVAMGAAAALLYALTQNKNAAGIQTQKIDDGIDDSVKPSVSLASEKPIVPQPKQKAVSVVEKNSAAKRASYPKRETTVLTPDEIEPPEVTREAAAGDEDNPEPKQKQRRERRVETDDEKFQRRVEGAIRTGKQLKKIFDELDN